MKVLFDTHVILDVLLDRMPFSEDGTQLLSRVEAGDIRGYLCATSISTIHHLAGRTIGVGATLNVISSLLNLFEIAPVSRAVLNDALSAGFTDFENAVLYQAAQRAGADAIVTRNRQAFKKASLVLYSPQELVHALSKIDGKIHRSSQPLY